MVSKPVQTNKALEHRPLHRREDLSHRACPVAFLFKTAWRGAQPSMSLRGLRPVRSWQLLHHIAAISTDGVVSDGLLPWSRAALHESVFEEPGPRMSLHDEPSETWPVLVHAGLAATSPASWKGNCKLGATEDTGDFEQNAHQLAGSTALLESTTISCNHSCFLHSGAADLLQSFLEDRATLLGSVREASVGRRLNGPWCEASNAISATQLRAGLAKLGFELSEEEFQEVYEKLGRTAADCSGPRGPV